MILFAFFESTKVSYRKRGQSLTPRAHEGRCYNSPWGTGGSVSDHCAYSSDASGLLSPAVKLVGRLCYRLSNEQKQRSLWNLSFLSLLCDKLIIKCLYKCGRREIAIFLLPSRHQVTGKMTTETFLYLLNGQKHVELYCVFWTLAKIFLREERRLFFTVFFISLS